MSDALAALAARVRAQRQHWLELDTPPRRALCWAEPGWEAQYRMGDGGSAYVRECVGLVIGWRGVTVGDLLPDDADAANPLAFSADLLGVLLADHPEWVAQLAVAVQQAMAGKRDAQEAARGN